MNNQLKYLLLLIITALTISSCKEDEYGDWKILNESWYQNFIETHKEDPDFYITESGLAYQIIHHGQYPQKPYPNSIVDVTYKGRLISGSEFDKQTNSIVVLSTSITGWQEGLVKMTRGSHYIFYIPSNLAYGDENSGVIPPYSTLIFDIHLNDVHN